MLNYVSLKVVLKVVFLYIPFIILLTLLTCNFLVVSASKDKLFVDVKDVPHNKVGMVLGTSYLLANGRPNYYFVYRIRAAAALYHAGKVDYLLLSGDNGRVDNNEPMDMKRLLIEEGVPANRIYLDYAGFRTLDSVVRSKEVFGQAQMTIISQKFHNERALFLAEQNGIDAVAFNAKNIGVKYGKKVLLREAFARVKAVLDVYLLRTNPKYLGPKNKIG